MKAEIAHASAIVAVENFNKDSLKKTITNIKNPLPDNEAIRAEVDHKKFRFDIEEFTPDKLKHIVTKESPSGTDLARIEIAQASTLNALGNFNKEDLKKVSTNTKNFLPTQNDIEEESKR